MRFARLIAAAVVVVAVAAGGFFAFAPPALGQGRQVLIGPGGDVGGADFEVFRGGGSRIGVAVRDVDQADVTREKLAAQAGAVVEEVRSDSAAARAGLKSGDVIVAFDGERVRSARQLERLVAETPAGRTVKASVQRTGAKVDVDITPETPANALRGPFKFEPEGLAESWPRIGSELKRRHPAMEFHGETFPEAGESFRFFGAPARGRLGVQVQELTDQLATYFGAKAGVLVSDVDEDSPAAKAGVKAGDVITEVNGKAVSDAGDLRQAVSRVDDGKTADLTVIREKKTITLKVDPEAPRRTAPRIRRTVQGRSAEVRGEARWC
jgi:serine protease Do